MLGIFMAMRYWPFSTAAAVLGKAQTVLQPAHDDLGVDDVDDAHGGVAQGDGHADEQDLPDNLPAGGGRRPEIPSGSGG